MDYKRLNDFGNVSEYSYELKRIRELAMALRSLRGESKLSWTEPAEYAVKYSYMHNKPAKALTVTLNPTGCYWAKSGGCTMCGEFEGSAKAGRIPDYIHIAQFAKAIADLVSVYNPSWLRINQEGNYANSVETTSIAQMTILRLATQIRGVERITIESRPQYLTESILKEYSQIMSRTGVELEIGMGFEAANDVVRNVCINKGERMEDYISCIERMNRYDILPLAYVLLKPPFITESEAISSAIQSIKTAGNIGFSRISLEPMCIHKYTVVDALARTGNYRVPWFWSIIEVVNQCKKVGDLGIGGVGFFPPSLHQSHNHCNHGGECNVFIAKAIADYAKTHDLSVFDGLDCDCKKEWYDECSSVCDIPLKDRINKQLNEIDVEKYKKQVESEAHSIKMEQSLSNSIYIARGSQISNISGGNCT